MKQVYGNRILSTDKILRAISTDLLHKTQPSLCGQWAISNLLLRTKHPSEKAYDTPRVDRPKANGQGGRALALPLFPKQTTHASFSINSSFRMGMSAVVAMQRGSWGVTLVHMHAANN